MKTYKGFDEELKCRGYQYEIGKEYEEEKAKACDCGFHACQNPLDVFKYYAPSSSRYCEVEQSGTLSTHDDDSKVASTKIKICTEIGIKGIIEAGVKFILEKSKLNDGKVSNTGNRSSATNIGDYSSATNTGDYSSATNTGDYSSANVEGLESVAISVGIGGKAKGAKGCFLVLAEWEQNNIEGRHRKNVKAVKVDGKKIKEDTFYILKDGRFEEATD